MRRPRKIIFGLLTLLLSLGLAEGLLRIPAALRHVSENFVQSPDGDFRFVSSSSDSRFTDPKPPGAFRVFCFGESAVEGSIYNPKSSFPKLLREMLADASRGAAVEVINCGATGTRSDFALRAFEQALRFQPDLMVVYSGNNEHTSFRRVSPVTHPVLYRADLFLSLHSRIYFLVTQAVKRGKMAGMGLAAEHLPPGPIKHRAALTPATRAEILATYQANLGRMAGAAREMKVPVMFAAPAVNRRDWPPVKSACGLPERECDDLDSDLRAAQSEFRSGRPDLARSRVEAVILRQPNHPLARFILGQLDLPSDPDDARRHLEIALEQDDSSIPRTKPSQVEAMRALAHHQGLPFVNFQAAFDQVSTSRVAGFDLLDDYCHPSLDGQALIAAGLAEAISARFPHVFTPTVAAELYGRRATYLGRLGIDNNFLSLRLQEMGFYLAFDFDDWTINEQALRIFARQRELVPGSTLAYLVEGLVRLRRGEGDAAARLFDQSLRENPEHTRKMISLYFPRFLAWNPPWLLARGREGTSYAAILNDYLNPDKASINLPLDQADRVFLLTGSTLADRSPRLRTLLQERRRRTPAPAFNLYPVTGDFRIVLSGLTQAGDNFTGTAADPRLIIGPVEQNPLDYVALEVEMTVAGPPDGQPICLYWRGSGQTSFNEENKACATATLAPDTTTYLIPLADDPDWVLAGMARGFRLDPGEGPISFRLARVRLLPLPPATTGH